jgi:hypothetical protein
MRNIALLVLLLCASACLNKAKVLDVHSAKVALPPYATASNETTRAAILRALQERTWIVEAEEPNTIVASVSAGGHSATASIYYDDLNYSIKHIESSPGLKYDGVEIHRRYNTWIKNLRKTIDKQLLQAPSQTPPPPTTTGGGEGEPVMHEPPVGPVTEPPDGKVPAAADPKAPPSDIDDDMPPAPPPL